MYIQGVLRDGVPTGNTDSNSCQFCKDVWKNSTCALVSLISMFDAANFMDELKVCLEF